MKLNFETFTKLNDFNVYIDDRGGRIGRYAVIHNNSIVNDCLNKKQALALALWCVKEGKQ